MSIGIPVGYNLYYLLRKAANAPFPTVESKLALRLGKEHESVATGAYARKVNEIKKENIIYLEVLLGIVTAVKKMNPEFADFASAQGVFLYALVEAAMQKA
jgi:hypothetical protein